MLLVLQSEELASISKDVDCVVFGYPDTDDWILLSWKEASSRQRRYS
jgi:hypothetical protein